MMRLLPSPWLIMAMLAAVGAAFGTGWLRGNAAASTRHALAEARLQARLVRVADALSVKEAARLALSAENDRLGLELDNAATIDPDAGRVCLGVDSVRRLNQR